MKFRLVNKKWWLVSAILGIAILLFIIGTRRQPIDFNSQVKPIFNKKCITCHGGVRRKSDFSLLFRSEALGKTESGKPAIVPGDPDKSEMIRRIGLKDPEERMPYKHEPLTTEETAILKQWIREGAKWGDHWAYLPVKPVVPPEPNADFFASFSAIKPRWIKNDIDKFIWKKLQAEKLNPSGEADRATLLRRVSLDITGLPADDIQAKSFLCDSSSNAYEKLVDSRLSSPHFGERWASMWLDLARYADTKGYERDAGRSIWRYRDWLINAFNEDKPYDRFITEQIAGDLLPDPTDAQLIATAFHRNTMTNDEGGTENEEFRTAAVLDRVNTTWEALMGTTFACVQCHSHPYDPFTHDEYYKFMAFFNDTRDEDSYADYPLLRQYSAADSLSLHQVIDWIKNNVSTVKAKEVNIFLKTWQPAINSLNADQFVNSELADTKWLIFRNHASARLRHVDLENKNSLIFRYAGFVNGGVWTIHLDKPGGPVLTSIRIDSTKGQNWSIAKTGIPSTSGVHDLYFAYINPNLKKPDNSGVQFDWFYFTQTLPGKDKPGFDSIQKSYWRLLNADVPTTPIMMDNPADMHRSSHVFERGSWLVQGKVVTPDVPHSLIPLPVNAPHNRMGLAMWMTSKQNPLMARTIVNRLWEQLFGAGLVETLEDFGTQGAAPSNPELLDWLAWKLMNDYRWSLKKLLKEILMSATYRQDSKVTSDMLEKDPFNKFYARGARVRLSAEQVRDQTLSVSNLLSEKMYGPSVMPYQPGGIWLSPWNGEDWKESNNGNQYRRALYTYWKRTAPYPSMITFDGVAREVCTARRIRTNTPLQALVTLNDSTYLNAARHFAYGMQKKGGNNPTKQIRCGYEMMIYKSIPPGKLAILEKLYNKSLDHFKNEKDKTCELVGEMDEHNNPETAALVVVANAMLNLDEWITKN